MRHLGSVCVSDCNKYLYYFSKTFEETPNRVTYFILFIWYCLITRCITFTTVQQRHSININQFNTRCVKSLKIDKNIFVLRIEYKLHAKIATNINFLISYIYNSVGTLIEALHFKPKLALTLPI